MIFSISDFKLGWRNLKRNRRRSVSTGLAICVGFVALNLLGAYLLRSYESLRVLGVYLDQKGHIQVRKKGSLDNFDSKPKKYLISEGDVQKIEKELNPSLSEKLEYTGKSLTTSALLSNGQKSHPIVGVGFDSKSYIRSIRHPQVQEHASFFLLDWQKNNVDEFLGKPEMIAVTPLIAEIMNFKMPLQDNDVVQIAGMTVEGDLNAVNSELGALHSTGAEFLESTIVLVPIEKIQELMGTSGLLSYSFYLKSFSAVPAARHIIDQYLKDNIPDLESFEYSDARINPFFEGSMGFLSVMGGFFLILICSAVSLTIINSLTMGIIERTREIGTLRAIGFNRNAIQKIFVAENLLITLCALLVGTGLSSIISHFINDAQIMFNPPGTANKIPFMLLWNLNVAFVASALLLAVTYASAWIVISRKMKSKLISLLNDTE